METSVIISGFGGQGALFAGQILAHAALGYGKEVTWIPSYGPEMRGGTAHCTVIVSDDPIGSPLVRSPDCVIAMSAPSVDKYEPLVKAGGILVVDSSVMNRAFQREDIRALAIPAHALAAQIGDQRLVNIAMLGGMVAFCGLLPPEFIETALRAKLPERHQHLLEANVVALYAGTAWVAEITSGRQ
jgi:2-oxoglutarate ferredoxin oxidoreductase subunit gamma